MLPDSEIAKQVSCGATNAESATANVEILLQVLPRILHYKYESFPLYVSTNHKAEFQDFV